MIHCAQFVLNITTLQPIPANTIRNNFLTYSVFGIGLYFYLLLFFIGFPLPWILGFVVTGLAVLRSIYLAYSLLFVTRIPCPLCFTSHLINLILFIVLWRLH